jgi:hypothetical protein
MRTSRYTITHMAQVLTILIATAAAGALSQATLPVASFAASHGTVFAADGPEATEEILATTPHPYRPAGSTWSVASGALQVAVSDGSARIVRPSGSTTLPELTPGESVTLFTRDRLVLRGRGALLTGNVGQDPVVASVVRVK